MAVDVERQLATLGAAWNTMVAPIGVDEILDRAAGPTSTASVTDRRDRSRPPRRSRWLTVTAAALVAALVAILALVRRGHDETPPATTVMTTTTVPSTPEGVGTWVSTGRLAAPCAFCSALLLDDGRVLVTGASDDTVDIVQVYDPETATFTAVRSTSQHHLDKSLALPDGRVLLTGSTGDLAVFDVAAGTIEPLGTSLGGIVIPVVVDDRILLFDSRGAYTLDVATGTTTLAGTMAAQRNDGLSMVAVPLRDGRVLVAGGWSGQGPTAEVYDPTTGVFTPTGSTNSIVDVFTATRLLDGRVLLVGGSDRAGAAVSVAEIYDPSTGKFTLTGSTDVSGFGHAATLLPDGRVLVIGSSTDPLAPSIAATYDPATGQFTPAVAPTGHRVAAAVIVLDDGNVLVLGNYLGNFTDLWATDGSTAEIYSLTGVEQPPGCCPPNPQDLTLKTTLAPDGWTPYVGRPLSVRMTVPGGGLEGASGAEYFWSELHRGDEQAGGGGRLALPPGCDEGCSFTFPLTFSPTDDQRSVDITIVITFPGAPPPAARRITITIAP